MNRRDDSHRFLKMVFEEEIKAKSIPRANEWTIKYHGTSGAGTKKPFVKEYPMLHFSISHSEEDWMCVVADCEIGLDIQKHKKVDGKRLAERFLHPEEAEWLAEHGYEQFFRLWALKEAFVKYTGEGLTRGLKHFSVVSALERPIQTGAMQKEARKVSWLVDERMLDFFIYEEIEDDGTAIAIISDQFYTISRRGV